VAHLVVTSFVVVATANHYWLDGLAAVAILAVVLVLQVVVPAAWRSVRASAADQVPDDAAAEPALAG
jgi:hypothetical protein